MTKEDLLNKINDYNNKSNIVFNINEEYIDNYDSVELAYRKIVETLIKEYIYLKYMNPLHFWDDGIETIVETVLRDNFNNIIF